MDEGEAGNSEWLVTFVGSGCSLENVASHDGGGAVNHALVLIFCGFRSGGVVVLRERDGCVYGWMDGWMVGGVFPKRVKKVEVRGEREHERN